MKNIFEGNWSGFSASIPGSGHIRHGLPCQDASAVVQSPRPALIVCDGRGSASRSQDGAKGAVDAFATQCAVFEPMLASILDADEAAPARWEMFCRILYRTLRQVQVNLASKQGISEKEFDFTVAAAIVGKNWIGCFQVGDGSIVLRQDGTPITAFLPDKGEFANQTHFLRENGESAGKFHGELFSAHANSGIAITSDGPEHLMFQLKDMTPGPIFSHFFDDLQNDNLTKQDIMDYLTRREWDNDPRGRDDRSIAILAPACSASATEDTPKQAEDINAGRNLDSETAPQTPPTAEVSGNLTQTVDSKAQPKAESVPATGKENSVRSSKKKTGGNTLRISCAVLGIALLGGIFYHVKTVENKNQMIQDLSASNERLKAEIALEKQINFLKEKALLWREKNTQANDEVEKSLEKQQAQPVSPHDHNRLSEEHVEKFQVEPDDATESAGDNPIIAKDEEYLQRGDEPQSDSLER